MPILLLDESLSVDVFYMPDESDYEDNIVLRIREDCPEDERIMRMEETNIFLTLQQAAQLAEALLVAVRASREDISPGDEG